MMDGVWIAVREQRPTGGRQAPVRRRAAELPVSGHQGFGRQRASVRWLFPLGTLAVLVIASCLGASPAGAQQPGAGRDLPITITSDRMEGDLKAGVITFMDRVKVVRGDTILYADRVETYPKKGAEDVDRIVAIGNVRVVRGSRLSTADRAEYRESEALLILSGRAKVSEGNNTVSGAVIRVYLDEERTEVEGDTAERPRFLFYPENGKGRQSVNPSE